MYVCMYAVSAVFACMLAALKNVPYVCVLTSREFHEYQRKKRCMQPCHDRFWTHRRTCAQKLTRDVVAPCSCANGSLIERRQSCNIGAGWHRHTRADSVGRQSRNTAVTCGNIKPEATIFDRWKKTSNSLACGAKRGSNVQRSSILSVAVQFGLLWLKLCGRCDMYVMFTTHT